MNPFRRLPLRVMLTLPYMVLILAVAGIVAGLSYRAGRQGVETWSDQLLVATVERIKQAVAAHVAGSAAVLEAAFPRGVQAPPQLDAAQLGALRTRFWLATSVHRDPNHYAYYGDRQGRFFGLLRHSEQEAELRLRLDGTGMRAIHRFTGIDGALGPAALETRLFDPRQRPWFRAAAPSGQHTWTSIYVDFKTRELVATRARAVPDAAGEPQGVVATDLSLQRVNLFLQGLSISPHGVAMVLEGDGKLIGVSRGPHLRSLGDGERERLNAAQSPDPMVAAVYRASTPLLGEVQGQQARALPVRLDDGRVVQVGISRLRDEAGLDWLVLVAVPRSDFLAEVEAGVRTGAGIALASVLAVALVGLGVLSSIASELRRLAHSVRRVGEGDFGAPIDSQRHDELGELARTFGDMQARLLTDPLTGLANRTAVMRRMEERLMQRRRRGDSTPFVVLFVDFNRFKDVNDRHGHDVGDRVLRELALRLRQAVRAEDLVARYAGDEFIVLLESVGTRAQAEAVRQHLVQTMAEPLESLPAPADGPAHAGAAIGMAVYPENGQDVDSLLKAADADMYRHKPAGP